MNTLAQSQDILLAYDPDFTGFTDGATPAASDIVGGDGYYEDFTAGLKRFVEDYPMLARGPPDTGGEEPRGPVDWKALVISFGDPGDGGALDDSDDSGGAYDDDDDNDALSDDSGDDSGDGGGRYGGAPGDRPQIARLGDFIVDANSGARSASSARRGAEPHEEFCGLGEMDETSAEASPYERFGAAASPYERFGAAGDQPRGSIIDFVADR